jgi:hypothetical protein
LKKKNKNYKKPPSSLRLIACIIILVVARNINILELGDLEFGFKKITYIIIILLSVAAIAYTAKQRDDD